MTDPVQNIGEGVLGPLKKPQQQLGGEVAKPSFGDLLKNQISQVNQMKVDADKAVEDLATGKRTDMDQVFMAVEKADLAFRALMEIRNKLMDAYEEINRMQIG
jgi:flagellar hook-basal body complex protein FliE